MSAASRPTRCATFRARLSWVVAFGIGLATPLAAAPAVEGSELKAAIVFNLLLFMEWPAAREPSPSSPLALCVRNGSLLQAPLERLSGRTIRSARLKVRVLGGTSGPDPDAHCHAVFADGNEAQRAWTMRAAQAVHAVVIADDTAVASDAAAVQLRELDRRFSFDINLPALRHSGVLVSSKLLRLARVVQE